MINVQKILEFYRELGEQRHQLPYDIDGIVIKVDSLRLQQELADYQKR